MQIFIWISIISPDLRILLPGLILSFDLTPPAACFSWPNKFNKWVLKIQKLGLWTWNLILQNVWKIVQCCAHGFFIYFVVLAHCQVGIIILTTVCIRICVKATPYISTRITNYVWEIARGCEFLFASLICNSGSKLKKHTCIIIFSKLLYHSWNIRGPSQ